MPASAMRRRPHSSSALTTPWAARSRLEQRRFGVVVGLHGAVMIKVVVAQVGERGCIETEPLNPRIA